MPLFILDEWLWSDASGENGNVRQRETFQFVFAIFHICDRIVVVRGSKFQDKASSFWKHTDTARRTFARFFTESILYNSAKTQFLDPDQLAALPDNLMQETQPEDRHLAQAQLTTRDSIVITTDTGLISALEHHRVPCKHRDNFVADYLAVHRNRQGR